MANLPARKLTDAPSPRRTPNELPENVLALYFREAASIPMLQPQEEITLAQKIERLETSMWSRILNHPGLVEPLLGLIETQLPERLKGSKKLCRASKALRSKTSAAARKKYENLCQPVAGQIRDLDRDRDLAGHLLKVLSDISRGHLRRLGKNNLRVNINSKSFKTYHRRVKALATSSQRARNNFVSANLRLVMSIVRRYNFGQLPLHDLIQEGNVGLIKAVGRFDYRRGYRFSTYASWWIRHAINRAIADKGRMVRIPVHLLDNYHKMSQASWQLSGKLGRTPTAEELGCCTGLGQQKVERLQKQSPTPSISLDNVLSDDDDRSYLDMLSTTESHSPSDSAIHQELSEMILRIIDGLTTIEADVMRRRFGLNDGREQTLKQIGADYELSRERIRQIQEQALNKIRRALKRRKVM